MLNTREDNTTAVKAIYASAFLRLQLIGPAPVTLQGEVSKTTGLQLQSLSLFRFRRYLRISFKCCCYTE